MPTSSKELLDGLKQWTKECMKLRDEALQNGDQSEAEKWEEAIKHTAEGVRKWLDEEYPFRRSL